MLRIVDRSALDDEVKTTSRAIFERIASVEAKIHGTSSEEIHFHELGGWIPPSISVEPSGAFARWALRRSMFQGSTLGADL